MAGGTLRTGCASASSSQYGLPWAASRLSVNLPKLTDTQLILVREKHDSEVTLKAAEPEARYIYIGGREGVSPRSLNRDPVSTVPALLTALRLGCANSKVSSVGWDLAPPHPPARYPPSQCPSMQQLPRYVKIFQCSWLPSSLLTLSTGSSPLHLSLELSADCGSHPEPCPSLRAGAQILI